MREDLKIDAAALEGVHLSADGSRLSLRLLVGSGRCVHLSLPTACLNEVMASVPRRVEPGSTYRVDSWSMGTAADGKDLVLTLQTPEAMSVSFILTSWQVDGMATVATASKPRETAAKTMH